MIIHSLFAAMAAVGAEPLSAFAGLAHSLAGAHSSLLFTFTGMQPAPTPSPVPTGSTGGTVALPAIVMVRGLTLGAVAFILGLLMGRPTINWLRDRGIGKHIRIEGPEHHQVKTGTPTMGGIIFLVPLAIVIAVFMDVPRFKSLLLPLGIVIAFGMLGGSDDLMSTVTRNKGGMSARLKMGWTLAIGGVIAWIMYDLLGIHKMFIPFITGKGTPFPEGIDIGIWFLPIVVVAIAAMSNAVNLIDGLDTLAGGTTAIAFVSYGIIAFLQGQEPVVSICFATTGALLAFLWFNAHPAAVFMGDAGSLTLGALLAYCALSTGQWLLLPLIGIVFVAVAISDILQVLYFKLTGGKRLFKMAPLHHHFEMIGWSETQVTMRFWLISILAGMLGVALALV